MSLKTIDNLCRICVQESHTFKHIYDQYILDIRLFEVINDLCQLNVFVGDGLPEYICPYCHGKLLEFQRFRQTSHEAKEALLSIKLKLEKMNAEACEVGVLEPDVGTQPLEEDWCGRQLPVESISQLLEVHIKEEPEGMTDDGPEDYSLSASRGSSLFGLEEVQSTHLAGCPAVISIDGESDSYGNNGEGSTLVGGKLPISDSNAVVAKTRKKCRKCFVPYCKNTTSRNAEKGFVNVPLHKDRRIEWFKAAKREISRMPSYELYCCGDHFNLPEDTENYMYHKTMGVRLRIKKDVLPHIFQCQHGQRDCDPESASSTGNSQVPSLSSPNNERRGHSIFGEGVASSSAQAR